MSCSISTVSFTENSMISYSSSILKGLEDLLRLVLLIGLLGFLVRRFDTFVMLFLDFFGKRKFLKKVNSPIEI